ncbi:MAG: magnesium/cobalt transporter CorA [Nitrospirota bacterium]
MINSFLLNEEKKLITNFKEINIQEALKNEKSLLWIDLVDPTDDEIDILSDDFKFHELAIEDCIFPQSQPKVDDFGTHIFIVIQGVKKQRENGTEELKTIDLDIFFGKNFVVTIQEESIRSITNLAVRCKQNPMFLEKGSDFLLHAIIDGVVDSYVPLLDEIDDKIEQIEDEVLTNPTQAVVGEIFSVKKKILAIRKIIGPQRAVIGLLSRRDIPFIKPNTLIYYRDIYDHLVRIGDTIDMYRDLTTDVLEVYFSGSSSRLTEVMKVLTIIATIMMPATLLTSYYGMNIHLPEFEWTSIRSISFVWALSCGATLGLLLFFRHRKWI